MENWRCEHEGPPSLTYLSLDTDPPIPSLVLVFCNLRGDYTRESTSHILGNRTEHRAWRTERRRLGTISA
ncbi:hypothetical protein VTJ04DRAFT_3954 [Mycothermus thermophilus]|uniref:uncharacterized protein n=1 Tax=Humicola insolens TaxID=85995 RepID=UPI00374478ED